MQIAPMELWREFFKYAEGRSVNLATPKRDLLSLKWRRNDIELGMLAADFCAQHYNDILNSVKSKSGNSVRICYPFSEFDRKITYTSATNKICLLADHVVVSAAPQLTCGAIGNDFLYDLTSGGGLGIGVNEDLTVFSPSTSHFGRWLRQCRPLLEEGLVTFLPTDDFWWKDEELAGVNPNNSRQDPVQWQLTEIARDFMASIRLGCDQFVPNALRNGLVVDEMDAPLSEYAFGELPSVDVSRMSPRDVLEIRRTCKKSFTEFATAWRESVKSAASQSKNSEEFRALLKESEKNILFDPYRNIYESVERLRSTYRIELGGLALIQSTLVSAQILGAADVATTGGLSGVTLVALLNRIMDFRRKKNSIIGETDQSYIVSLLRKSRHIS
jgi:hypothetical protein